MSESNSGGATLADAKALCERMRNIRVQCSRCTTISYWVSIESSTGSESPLTTQSQFEQELNLLFRKHLPPGYEPNESLSNATAFIKRCDDCASTPAFPWAVWLDAAKVLEHLRANPHPFDVAGLEKTLRRRVMVHDLLGSKLSNREGA